MVSIDQNDLPLDAAIGSLKLIATPYYRSGVLIDFPVKRERGGTLRVVLEDGSDLPSGALSQIEGKDEEFPVALRGEAYLTGLEATNRIRFTWKGQSCTIDVPYPIATTEIIASSRNIYLQGGSAMTKVNFVAKHKLKRVMGRFAMLIACASALVLSSVSPAFATLTL